MEVPRVLCDFQRPQEVAVGVVVVWMIVSYNSLLMMMGGVLFFVLSFLMLQTVCFNSEVGSRKKVLRKWIEITQLNEEDLRSCSNQLLETQSHLVNCRLEKMEQIVSHEAKTAKTSRKLKTRALESQLNWHVSHKRLEEEEELRSLREKLELRVEQERRKNAKKLKAAMKSQNRKVERMEQEELEVDQEQWKILRRAKRKAKDKVDEAKRQ